MEYIFETERLLVRELSREDLEDFHDLQNNFNVMQYATGTAQSYEENVADLDHVISSYAVPGIHSGYGLLKEDTMGSLSERPLLC
jgi:hypothetical protein